MTYYEAFGIEPGIVLALDVEDLQQRFYRLSREFHPDRFTRKPVAEQQAALDRTSLLNDGFRVLKDPVRRAEYVLKLAGFDIGEQRSKDVPPELLEEVFELNMALEESDESQLSTFRQRFEGMLSELDGSMAGLFQQHDLAATAETRQGVLQNLRGLLNRRRYIENLLLKIPA